MQRIVVLGGGFAGLWAAVGAARKLDELGIGPEAVRVTLVNRDAYHNIRVRNYEPDLSAARVPLDAVLGPIGVERSEARVTSIDLAAQAVQLASGRGGEWLPYDRLILATGSQLHRPPLPGVAEHTFSVDTYAEAVALDAHLHALAGTAAGASTSGTAASPADGAAGRWTAAVVGAGLTGIEIACELPDRLRAFAAGAGGGERVRVVLLDQLPYVGSDMGPSARPVIEEALAALGVETRLGVGVQSVDPAGVTLAGGEHIPAHTTIWTAGMRASPLTAWFPVERDPLGRLPVDACLKVRGLAAVFAAGDVAAAPIAEGHCSVMSCQHGRPMGRYAGHNAVCDLLGLEPLPLRLDTYVTCLDLGPWGAVYTRGWDRLVVAHGAAAKQTKREINRRRIYPPLNGDRAAILAAGAPVVQAPPAIAAPTGSRA